MRFTAKQNCRVKLRNDISVLLEMIT